MSYYTGGSGNTGDFYQGDYYGGDPFWGAIGGLIKRGAGALMGRLGGKMPGGAVLAKIPAPVRGAIQTVGGAIMKHPVLSAAGAAGVIGAVGGGRAMMGAGPGVGQKGFHMSKARRGVAPHLVRNRRMHVTNPRALRRAIRRASGFARLAKKVMRFTSPRPPRGRGYFKTRRRGGARVRA